MVPSKWKKIGAVCKAYTTNVYVHVIWDNSLTFSSNLISEFYLFCLFALKLWQVTHSRFINFHCLISPPRKWGSQVVTLSPHPNQLCIVFLCSPHSPHFCSYNKGTSSCEDILLCSWLFRIPYSSHVPSPAASMPSISSGQSTHHSVLCYSPF